MLAYEMDGELLWASGWVESVATVDLDSSGGCLWPGRFLKKMSESDGEQEEEVEVGDAHWEEFTKSKRIFGVVHEDEIRVVINVE